MRRAAWGAGAAGGLSLAVLIGAVLAVNLAAGHARFTARFVTADSLWSLALLKDIVENGGRLADWNVGQHADLFPDHIFATVAYLVTRHHEDFLLAFATLNALYYFGICWYCLTVCRRGARGAPGAALVSLFPALLAAALPLFARSWGLFDWFLHYDEFPTRHFGEFFGGLLAAVIAIDCFDRPAGRRAVARLAAAVVLFLLCALSDKLTILVVVPAFLATAIHAGTMRRPASPMLPVAVAAVLVAAAMAYGLNDWLWNHFVQLSPNQPRLRLDTVLDQGWRLLTALFRPGHPVQQAVAALLVASALWLAADLAARMVRSLAGRRRPSPGDAAGPIVAYLVATVFLNPAAIIALGLLVDDAKLRYVFPALYYAVLAPAAWLVQRLPATWSRRRAMLATGAACLPLLAVPLDLSAPPFARAPVPPLVRCLEAFGKGRDLTLGLGSHWDTYPVIFHSGGRIVVRTIYGTDSARNWINSLEWYAPRADGRLFTFIIMSSEWPDQAALGATFGPPAERLDCATLGPGFGDKVIWAYDRPGAEHLTALINRRYLEMKTGR